VLARHLQHLPQLLGRGLDDARVAVAGIVDEVAGGEVQVLLAVDIGDDAALAFATITGSPGVSPRTHHVLLVLGDDRVGFGGREGLSHCGSLSADRGRGRARTGGCPGGAKRYRSRRIDVKLRIYGDVTVW
jgi:hypothetical protein